MISPKTALIVIIVIAIAVYYLINRGGAGVNVSYSASVAPTGNAT